MNELLNKRIINSTKQLFSTTFKIEIEAGAPYIIEADSTGGWDTSGVVSVTGEYTGLIAVRFKKELPEILLNEIKISGLRTEMYEPLTTDMVGELTNIIAGNTFSESGMGDIFLSIPVTIKGENHILSWSREPRITVIPFKAFNHSFHVETEIKKINQ